MRDSCGINSLLIIPPFPAHIIRKRHKRRLPKGRIPVILCRRSAPRNVDIRRRRCFPRRVRNGIRCNQKWHVVYNQWCFLSACGASMTFSAKTYAVNATTAVPNPGSSFLCILPIPNIGLLRHASLLAHGSLYFGLVRCYCVFICAIFVLTFFYITVDFKEAFLP